jgi:hypothetical protein
VICCGMAVKRVGMLEGSVSKMKVLWRWRQGHWLVKAHGIRHAFCIKCMKLLIKYFFLADFYFYGVVLDLVKCIFFW